MLPNLTFIYVSEPSQINVAKTNHDIIEVFHLSARLPHHYLEREVFFLLPLPLPNFSTLHLSKKTKQNYVDSELTPLTEEELWV